MNDQERQLGEAMVRHLTLELQRRNEHKPTLVVVSVIDGEGMYHVLKANEAIGVKLLHNSIGEHMEEA